jgi:hypothetical protein
LGLPEDRGGGDQASVVTICRTLPSPRRTKARQRTIFFATIESPRESGRVGLQNLATGNERPARPDSQLLLAAHAFKRVAVLLLVDEPA